MPQLSIPVFFSSQRQLEQRKIVENSSLVGYVLETGYDSFTIATNTAMQSAAGALCQGGYLLGMSGPDCAVLLRLQETAPTPLNSAEQMTIYELSKRAMPDLDPMTNTDMSWSCFHCDVLGCFYTCDNGICFAGDLPSLSAAGEYRIYQPNYMLSLIVNGVYDSSPDGVHRAVEYSGQEGAHNYVPWDQYAHIGNYRPTEYHADNSYMLPYNLYLNDVVGRRMALLGKTRSGKSNTIKMIGAALLRWNETRHNLGQVIIDTNGEYANDNPQDGKCLKSRFPEQCIVYSVRPRQGSGAKVLRCNFYLMPDQAVELFRDQLAGAATYIKAFLAANVPSLEEIRSLPPGGERIRAIRRVQLLWAILYEAGFPANEQAIASAGISINAGGSPFDPCFSAELRRAISASSAPKDLQELTNEWKAVYQYSRTNPSAKELTSASGNPILETDDLNMLGFLVPGGAASGVKCLSACRYLHHPEAGNYTTEIPAYLDQSMTVILDMSNARPSLVEFLTREVCTIVFQHQEALFVENSLGDHYVQLYAEEAHNYFPASDKDTASIFSRIAKEGAKYHIGLVYSTQSPSTISGELLSQTENFVVAHMDSEHEVDALVRRSAPYRGVSGKILKTRTPGYVHILTASQRFPVPVQVSSFKEVG